MQLDDNRVLDAHGYATVSVPDNNKEGYAGMHLVVVDNEDVEQLFVNNTAAWLTITEWSDWGDIELSLEARAHNVGSALGNVTGDYAFDSYTDW